MEPQLPDEIEYLPGVPLNPPLFDRTDIYWPPLMWAGGTELVWEDRIVAEQLGSLTKRETKSSMEAVLWHIVGHQMALDLLAVLLAWGTMTVEQAFAAAGHPYHCDDPCDWRRQPRVIRFLFLAGLIERGRSVSPAAALPAALRIRKGPSLRDLLHRLDADQLAWVTGGRKPEAPTRGDRHNIACSELGLLIAESSYVAAVLGPTAAAHHNLDTTGYTDVGRSAADLVVVLESGQRIAIETTCSSSPALRHKIRRWCDVLTRASHSEQGLRVIWVDAADPVRQTPAEVLRPLCRIIAEEVARHPMGNSRRIFERMVVTRWKWWAGPDGPSDALALLAGYRPDPGGLWKTTNLFGELDRFDPIDGRFQNIATEARLSAGCPAALRAKRPRASDS